jgi:F0F1-type ATP synthase delta subunit
MSNRTSAARYARALFEVAQQESDIQKVQQDLDALVATIAEHPELGRVFASRRSSASRSAASRQT